MLSLVLAIGSFAGAVLMGVAVLSMGSADRKWRGHARPDERGHTLVERSGAAFQPLQMAPFTLRWPSETDRKDTSIPELPWPSENWDDDYFGTRSRDDVRRIAETADALDAKRARTTQQAQRKQAGIAEPEPEDFEPPKQKKSKKQRKKDLREGAARRAGAAAEDAASAAVTAAREVAEDHVEAAAAEFFAEVGVPAGAPSPDEIAALVREHGLQGAIDRIRRATGWDFPTATQHLAQVLRSQR